VVQPGFAALTDRYRNLGWLVAAGLLMAGLGIGASRLGLLADADGLPAALGSIAIFPAVACALTFLLRDHRRPW
jgi:hypothetical protein